jgi:hypothetical protein
LPADGHTQYGEKEPEPELATGINVVTGTIQYGSNNFYITDRGSAMLGPVFRYDHPVKLSAKRDPPRYIYWVAQAGFLFGKAKVFDSLYFHPKNPAYLPLSVGIYNKSALSVGAEVFFWKGLGTRDIWGIKFISIGYNTWKCRINASALRYMQVVKARNGGTVFSFDFLWKLIK